MSHLQLQTPVKRLANVASYLLLLLAVLAISGCGSSKRKELKPLELESISSEVAIDALWSRRIGKGMGKYYHQFQLAVDEHHLYAASADGRVYQLDKQRGRVRWRVSLDSLLSTGVAIDQRHVYVATVDGILLALNRNNGEQVWAFELNSELSSPPSVSGDHVILQTSSGSIYNIDSVSGEQRWRYDSSMPALSLRGSSKAAFFANFAVLGQANGKLVVLDLTSGELRWDPRVAHAQGDTEIERMVDVDSTPRIIDERLFAVSYQGQLVALELSSGRPLWSVDESSYHDLATGLGNIYVSSANAVVSAYDRRTGDVKWSQQGLLRRKITAPVTHGSYLLLADYQGYIHVLAQSDGRFVARKRLNRQSVKTMPVSDGERFYLIADNGRLKAYQIGRSLK